MATLKFAVIGHPVAHSLSPKMHTANFASIGFDATYEKFDVAPEDVAAFVRTRNGAPSLICAVNRSGEERELEIPFSTDGFSHVFGTFAPSKNGAKLPAFGCLILF